MVQSNRQGTVYPTIVPPLQHLVGAPPLDVAIMRHAEYDGLRLSPIHAPKRFGVASHRRTGSASSRSPVEMIGQISRVATFSFGTPQALFDSYA